MKFLLVLLAVAIEHLLPQLDSLRDFRVLRAAEAWAADRFGAYRWWTGPGGVLLGIAVPLAGIAAVLALVGPTSVLGYMVSLVVLLASLGPRDLSQQVEEYLTSLTVNDQTAARAVAAELLGKDPSGAAGTPEEVARAILVLVNERLFAPLVWFVLLGPLGAALFRLAAALRHAGAARPAGFRHCADFLSDCLAWLPARLMALGYAVTGSMVHALAASGLGDRLGLHDSNAILERAGLGALQIDDVEEFCAADAANRVVLIDQVKSLIGRSLFAWLTIYAALTIAGWSA